MPSTETSPTWRETMAQWLHPTPAAMLSDAEERIVSLEDRVLSLEQRLAGPAPAPQPPAA